MPAPMMAAKSIAHSGIDGNVRATPAARASARQAGLTLAEVKGTGPMGRIQSDDVTMHLEGQSGEICGSTPVGPAIWSPNPARCMLVIAWGQASRWFCFMALPPTARAGHPLKRRLALISR
ncbi:E3 binding domain-containing protein [Gemmobacter lanyuensis]